MTDYLDLGPVPANEDCAQVGSDDYTERARQECRVYIRQLERAFPQAAEKGVSFRLKSQPHDFGTYYEVFAYFNDENEVAVDEAYRIERSLPGDWDSDAQVELYAASLEAR